MSKSRSDRDEGPGKGRGRLPRGVSALFRARGGRRYRASLRRGKGVEVHLGLYETPWLAAFAYNVAAEAIGRGGGIPPNAIPDRHQPDAAQVREITARVRRRLGLRPLAPSPKTAEAPPDPDRLRSFFEVTVLGYWRDQVAGATGGEIGQALDAAARRVVEAASLLFWDRSAGHPEPEQVLSDLLADRLDRTFRKADLTREVLDDDGDEPIRVARWLVLPDALPAARGFREEVRYRYPERFGAVPGATSSDSDPLPEWAEVLGLRPPYSSEGVRLAYRVRSKSAHPDAGGSQEAFVRLRAAYSEAIDYCELLGL